MFVRKSVLEVEKDLSDLHKRVDKIDKEMHRLELLERMQAQHEIVLAKKIADINRFDAELKKIVKEEDLEDMREQLKKLEQHDAVLVENSRFIHELTKEISKVKEGHENAKHHSAHKGHVSHEELDKRFDEIKEALTEVAHVRNVHKKHVTKDDVEALRKELHDRMAQLEYQNKLLMSYLKKVDQLLRTKF